MIRKNYKTQGEHDYCEKNFDIDLYKAGINILNVEATPFPNGACMFVAEFEFLAQYADGQRWIKDSSMAVGDPGPFLLATFKKQLIDWVKKARAELRTIKLNGEDVNSES